MKLTINRDTLTNGIGLVLSAISAKAAMPILANILIEAEAETVRVVATNIDQAISCKVQAKVSEPGAITIPGRRFAQIVRALPNLDTELHTDGRSQLFIKSGSSKFRVAGMAKDDFPTAPEVPEGNRAVLDQVLLAAMLRNVAPCQSTDETRFALNAVNMTFEEDKVTFAATDGRRLGVHTKSGIGVKGIGGLLVPAKTISELTRLLQSEGTAAIVAESNKRVHFVLSAPTDSGFVGDVVISSRLVESAFPVYQRVIPDLSTYQSILIERETLKEVVHRTALVTSERSNSVKFAFKPNVLELFASSPDLGEAHGETPIDYNGTAVSVAFNPTYFLGPLQTTTQDKVKVYFRNETTPGVIETADGFLCVVMPVRLN